MSLEQRPLGDSPLTVSSVSLGSWLTYSGGVEAEQTAACTRAAFDAGITFFDTANVYGTGASETAWGELLKDYDRDGYVLATKVYFPMGPEDKGLSKAQIAKQIDASLARLQVDHVDLYQCHRYDEDTPLEETLEALDQVVRDGKARALGFSEWAPEQIERALALADEHGWTKFVSSQPQYSALWRGPEAEVIPLSARSGISQVVWSPLAQGVLTGKYTPGDEPPADSRAASEAMGGFISRFMDPDVLAAVQRLKPVAAEAGLTLPQLALAWVLREENVASAIIGASKPEQVHQNAAAAGVTLTPDTLEAIDAALGDVPVR